MDDDIVTFSTSVCRICC